MSDSEDGPNREWRPDPFGRYELRRFFLGVPTSLVKSGEVVAYDQIDLWLPTGTPPPLEPRAPASTPVAETPTPSGAVETQEGATPSPAAPGSRPEPDAPAGAAPQSTRTMASALVSRAPLHGKARAWLAVAGILILIGVPLGWVLGGSS